ncbi:hypothetical protein Pan54_12630 [Rubinisphaera italica]|uniref:Uncharacterized protein n=1 Tax=Rubinisphaera italica TaxID=2527969 RepID=A0A5C5XD52_9PLAN|nr:hypothetical protein Pan54_12630 [Rubinisphaera italica]
MINDYLSGTTQNEVMGVGNTGDHALRVAHGVPRMIQSYGQGLSQEALQSVRAHWRCMACLSGSISRVYRSPGSTAVDTRLV